MAGTTIDAKDPKALLAVVKATATTPTRQGTLAADLFTYSAAIAQGKSKDDAVKAVIDGQVKRERATSGRSLSEPVNAFEELVVPAVKMAEDVAPAIFTATGALAAQGGGAVVGNLAGDIVKDGLGAVNGLINYALTFPSVADYLKGVRAKSGAEATARYAQDADLLDSAAAMAWTAARQSPEAAAAFQVLFPDLAGTADGQPFTATAGDIVNNHPDLFDVTYVTVQADNSVVIREVQEARTDILNKLGKLSSDVNDGLTRTVTGLGELQQQQNELAKGQAGLRRLLEKAQEDAQKRAEAEKAAAEQVAYVKALYDGAQGTINGVAALATLLGDPKVGRDVAQFGGAIIQTVAAAHKVVNAVGDVISKGLSVVTGLGMAAATGNLLGVVVNLVSLFAPSGPTPEQQILEGIQRIEESIANLHKAVETGFKRIDEKLDRIYDDIRRDLVDLTRKADLTLQDLADMRRRVARNQEALDEITVSMAAYFGAEQRRELYQTINAALGYRDRNAQDMSQAEFNEYASELYTWATDTCFNQTSQPLDGRNTKLEFLPVQLRSGDRADHASFVNRALKDNGIQSFIAEDASSGRAPLPNTLIWYVAARGYLQLQGEWPTLADPTDSRRADIAAAGDLYRRALAASAGDPAFSRGVADKYIDAGRHFGRSVDQLRERFQIDELPKLLGHTDDKGRAVRCDILATTASTPIDYDWALPSVMKSAFGGPDLPVPEGLKRFMPAGLAWVPWLRAGEVDLHYDLTTSPTTTKITIGGGNLRTVTQTVAATNMQFSVYATVAGRRLESRIPSPSHVVVGANRPRDIGLQIWPTIRQEWKRTIESTPVSHPPTDPALDAAIGDGLRRARAGFRDFVVEQARPGGRLDTSVQRLDGAAALVEAVTGLVAPIPRANDDILRAFFDGPALDAGGLAIFAGQAPEALTRILPAEDIPSGPRGVGYGLWLEDQIVALVSYYKERMAAWAANIADGAVVATYPDVDEALLRLNSAASLLLLLDRTRKFNAALQKRRPTVTEGGTSSSSDHYVVVAGDTLYKIAKKFGVTGGWKALAAANRDIVTSPPVIVPGMRLKIPR